MILNRHCVLLVTEKTGTKKGTRPFPSCLLQYHTASKAFFIWLSMSIFSFFLKTIPCRPETFSMLTSVTNNLMKS